MKQYFILLMMAPVALFSLTFNDIKGRVIRQYELADIMMDLGLKNDLASIERWKMLSPSSFKGLDFTRAYMLAADRHLQDSQTNLAMDAYVRAYQQIGKHAEKPRAAFMASFLLYATDKRAEALFYINRALEIVGKDADFENKMNDLKRRITWRYFSRMDNLPDNAVSVIAFDGDDVWIGMWSGGLARYTRSAGVIDIFTPKNTELPSPFVRDILVKPDIVWIAMHSGLAYFNKQQNTWRVIPEFTRLSVKRLIEVNGTIYAATLYRGVFASTNGGASWQNIVPNKTVLDIAHTEGKLFIATAEQGVFIHENGSTKALIGENLSVKSFFVDTNSTIWMGTYGKGLFHINVKDGRIIKQYRENDLGSDYIETLVRVDGVLWAGTLDAGAAYLEGRKWKRLGLRQGLPGTALTTIVREGEHLWFGTLSGGIGIYLFKELNPPEAIL
ncbi:MAG: hypothetical protein ACRC9L_08405 [Brevinema sp.]